MPHTFEFHGTVYSDLDNGAREHGMNRGYDHANFVSAYGQRELPECPDRFADDVSRSHWESGFSEGAKLWEWENDLELE